MSRVLVKAALAVMLALLFAVAPARCDSTNVNLVSSTGGMYAYTLVLVRTAGLSFSPGDTLTLTDLAGVTGASTPFPSLFSASSTSTSASAEDTHLTVSAPGGITLTISQILTVDSTSLRIGTIDWELSGPGFSTPLTGTTEGPVSAAVAAPEPSSVALMLAGIGLLPLMRKRIGQRLPQAS
jgi:hypothetical protein